MKTQRDKDNAVIDAFIEDLYKTTRGRGARYIFADAARDDIINLANDRGVTVQVVLDELRPWFVRGRAVAADSTFDQITGGANPLKIQMRPVKLN